MNDNKGKGCTFFWQHRWSKWELIKSWTLENGFNDIVGKKYDYQRTCENCGKPEFMTGYLR